MKKRISILLILILILSIVGCQVEDFTAIDNSKPSNIEDIGNNDEIEATDEIHEDGYYTSLEDVSLYLYIYEKLPNNFITKKEAIKLGWESKEGNLWDVTDKMSIGGDNFGNREGILPESDGRKYYECDINYEGGYRGAERIVYSNDGLIYYTEDHYKTFTLLYGDE